MSATERVERSHIHFLRILEMWHFEHGGRMILAYHWLLLKRHGPRRSIYKAARVRCLDCGERDVSCMETGSLCTRSVGLPCPIFNMVPENYTDLL